MPDTPMNYPPMPEEKLKKLQHYYENGLSVDGIPKKVQEHLARVKTMGGGQGIEFLSNLNKDYLGAFMAPFSRDVDEADIVIVGQPLEKSAPMNASHKYGPKVIRELSKNFMNSCCVVRIKVWPAVASVSSGRKVSKLVIIASRASRSCATARLATSWLSA